MLTDLQKSSMFKMLKTKTLTEVGYEFGLDKKYKKTTSMLSAVNRVVAEVKANPEKFATLPETIDEVTQAMQSRIAVKRPAESLTLREQKELIKPDDIKGLVIGGRNKAAALMHEKLERIGKSKKLLDNVSLGELAKVVGIMVDKAQILQGQSTENIAIMSKNIDSNMSPEDAIAAVMRMREETQAK